MPSPKSHTVIISSVIICIIITCIIGFDIFIEHLHRQAAVQTPPQTVAVVDGCKVIKTSDGSGTTLFVSVCNDQSAVSWRGDDGVVRHTLTEQRTEQ